MANSAETIDLTPEQDGGVLKEIIKEGSGDNKPGKGDRVFVHYVGTLEKDGSKFDSSRDRDEKFEFKLGAGEVIKSWDLCVASMKKGEICKVTCKSEYAYGESGSPPKIPPSSTLLFEVELFEWKGEDLSPNKDGGILRSQIAAGDGYSSPSDGALVKVSIIGKYEGKIFDERNEVSFLLGEGSEHDIPEGIERALERFKKSERSQITLSPKYAFDVEGNAKFNIPPNSSVEYEVCLHSFEKAKGNWEMDTLEKIEQAKIFKERGTTFFKQYKYKLAIRQYKKIINFMQTKELGSDDDEHKDEVKTLELAGRLNLSMCYLKLDEYSEGKVHANEAIILDPKSVKAYFRFGQALLGLRESEEALKNFRVCLKLEENNKAAAQQVRICLADIQKYKNQEKKLYSGMFDKFAGKS